MSEETILKIKNTPILQAFLKEHSEYYKYLYRDNTYVKKLEDLAKEYYQVRVIDKLERFHHKLNLLQVMMNLIE